mgnify:CR=1 FL=1
MTEPRQHPRDPLHGVTLQALLEAMTRLRQRGATVIVITHRMNVLAAVAKILVLKDGLVDDPRKCAFDPTTLLCKAGADEALMLDPRGFVASCNSTNFFIVRGGEIWTSTSLYSFKGITQHNVIDAWRAAGRTARECDFTLAQVYSADEAFVTGTLGGVTPVTKVDGRPIGDGKPGKITKKLMEDFKALTKISGVKVY